MKKLLCFVLCLSLVVSMAVFTGCGGGGGSSFFSYFSAAIVIAVIASSAGAASPLAFAASSREGLRGSTLSNKYEAVLYIDDVQTALTDKVLVSGAASDTLGLETPFTANVAKENVEYKVVFRKKGNQVGLTVVGAATNISQGETKAIGSKAAPIEANVETTAEALVFDKWKALSKVANKSFQNFQLVKVKSDIDTVKAAVEKDLSAVFTTKVTTFPTAESAAVTAADNTPSGITTMDVPANKTTTKDISALHNQVELAISESLKTALNNVRISAQPTTIRASTLTEAVPGFGSNNLVNPEKMMSLLLSTLPTGGNIENGPELDFNSAGQIATWTASTKTLEITDIATEFPSMKQYISNMTVIKNVVSATVTNGVLAKIEIGPGTVFETKEYNAAGTLLTEAKLTMVSGLEVSSDYSIQVEATPEFESYFAGAFNGKNIYATGTEITTITFSNPAVFKVELKEDGKTSNANLQLSNLSGSYTFSQNFRHYKNAWNNGSTEFGSFMKDYAKTLNSRSNTLNFAANQLKLAVSLTWPNEGVILEQGQLTIPVSKQTSVATEHDLKYSVVNATGKFKVRYAGSNHEKYGYIDTLSIDMSEIGFDPANDNISDGAKAIVTKTNTDQTVETLSYKVVNGAVMLQQAANTKFAGGNEKIEEHGNSTIISGTVNFISNKPQAGASMSVSYRSVRDNSSNHVTTRAVVTYGAAVKTMFFKWYHNQGIVVNETGEVFEGNIPENDGSDPYATFTAYNSGGLLSIAGGDSYHFAVEF